MGIGHGWAEDGRIWLGLGCSVITEIKEVKIGWQSVNKIHLILYNLEGRYIKNPERI